MGHTHKTESGVIVKCYHECRNLLTSPAFYIGTFLSFPIEHLMWEKLSFLKDITVWMGL